MACCVLSAYCISHLIKACEFLDINLITAKYNEFDDGPTESRGDDTAEVDRLVCSRITLDGLTCAACVASVETAVSKLDGVERVAISLPLSRGTVVHRQAVVSVDDIIYAVESRGYGAEAGERTAQQNLEILEHNAEIRSLRTAFSNAAVLSSIISVLEAVVWFNFPLTVLQALRLTVAGIAIWIQGTSAKAVHRNAWRRGLSSSLTMDTMVSLSLALGTALSVFNVALFGLYTAKVYWSSISFLTTVIVGGRLLDLVIRKRSTTTFAKLYQLQSQSMFVQVRRPRGSVVSDHRSVDAATLVPRDEIVLGTGSVIPCDCYIVTGETVVDQSTMTGESPPAKKRPGDFLMSGTQNLSAEVVAVVAKPQEDSALANLISSISTATETSDFNNGTDLIISRFVVIILFLTAVGFVYTLRSRWGEVEISLSINMACERAMAILASACPCALGLAAPSAVMAGLDAAWLRGVIVKGGAETLKSIATLSHFVMDKTGTLTTGKLSVAECEGPFDDFQRILICAAERDDAQTHPVAQAVFQWALTSLDEEQRRLVNAAEVRKYLVNHGNGISCDVQLHPDDGSYAFHAGSERFLLEAGIEISNHPKKSNDAGNETLVHFAFNTKYSGSLHLRDTVRPEAAAVIAHLKSKLSLDIAMLTGDVETEARRVSKVLGITALFSHSLPSQKRSLIEHIRDRGHYVAMMGDGLNDSPALAAANVGICVSTGVPRPGSSVSEATNSQVSDVIFTSPDLLRLPELLTISHKTMQQSNWNMQWAIAYNVVAVSLAMGVAEPIGISVDAARAGTMMAFSSISVLAWSVWLRYDLSRVSFKSDQKG
ncbi:hypothetical protein LTR37_016018 [Vermiconidia calcicola]|uniref:Uncharacterized protein n=1 Tax=Vermiconidia calcicola TaxID=1690605 RepID=A0ACC3MQM5_9PEZI|nr:hypothetical protein LTR37_016018 [Vermiconidia calcicola]